MSVQYDTYLHNHISNVEKAFEWLNDKLGYIFKEEANDIRDLIIKHDQSKFSPEEYDAYDAYFYGQDRSYAMVTKFNTAWLHHIHNNPHHWQYWVLFQDEGTIICIDMPLKYIIEMICDWWSFSWNDGNLFEIFSWYEDNKNNMELSEPTRVTVETILNSMRNVLEGNDE